MPESIVQVTEGSGKKLHTWQRTIGANNVEDEYVLLGENPLASYMVNAYNISAATANSHILQIMAGSTLKVRIRRIEVWQRTMATTAALMDLALYRLTTAGTGGTAVTPTVLDPADSAAGFTAMTLPAVKVAEFGIASAVAQPYLMQTVGASAQLAGPIAVWDFDRPRSKPFTLAAGTTNGLAVKTIAAHAGATLTVQVWADESSF